MNRFNLRSTCQIAVAVPLILALLASMPFSHGLLLHDHSDHGVHTHTVTIDDLNEGDSHASWHRHDYDIHDDEDNDERHDSDDGERTDPLFIFMNAPALAASIHGSSGAVLASSQYRSSKVLPRSMVPSHLTATAQRSPTPRLSAHSLRPAFALDALLQSSLALLL